MMIVFFHLIQDNVNWMNKERKKLPLSYHHKSSFSGGYKGRDLPTVVYHNCIIRNQALSHLTPVMVYHSNKNNDTDNNNYIFNYYY